ncbi:hypothetical protein VTI28DRAFT_357 [Corynascus sepedonium]
MLIRSGKKGRAVEYQQSFKERVRVPVPNHWGDMAKYTATPVQLHGHPRGTDKHQLDFGNDECVGSRSSQVEGQVRKSVSCLPEDAERSQLERPNYVAQGNVDACTRRLRTPLPLSAGFRGIKDIQPHLVKHSHALRFNELTHSKQPQIDRNADGEATQKPGEAQVWAQ